MPKIQNTKQVYPPYASLTFIGKHLDPEILTDVLKIQPDKKFKRGDKKESDGTKRRHGFWKIKSSEHIKSLDLIHHLEWLLKQISPKNKQIAKILKIESVNAEISCFWIMPNSHEILILNPELISQIKKINIKLKLSIYSPD